MLLRVARYAAVVAVIALLAGCAKFPAGSTSHAIREMSFHITFGGPINDDYYYFIPLDTGGGTGPVPVFPGITAGEGWITGSATYYVEYHQRQYTIFKITNLQPFHAEPLGAPIRSTIPEVGSTSLQFTIDLNTIDPDATLESLDVNVITTDQPTAGARFIDALGRTGGDFANIDVTTPRTFINSESLTPEASGDVMDQNMNFQPKNAQTNPLDIVDWSITVDV